MSRSTPPAPIAASCWSSPMSRTLPPRPTTNSTAASRERVSAIPASSITTSVEGPICCAHPGRSPCPSDQVSLARVSVLAPICSRSAAAAAADGARPTTVPPPSVHAPARARIAVVLPAPAGAIASCRQAPEVAMAGLRDGHAVTESAVDMALLESAANGITLNAGQAALVRTMATSGACLQLAIAPAGAGKTTAMRALAGAWTEGGGTVVGLAPSAAAAAALREQIGASTDTLAKLTWSLGQGDLPGWAQQIGPSSLVVIDEAGMADTLSLDAAVEFVVGRGGSVRLIGDDQQLAAIGAGGVLRDIQATHGAARLAELLRFADPAEGAASLALREGQTEALGFYLDAGRVNVGDLATLTEDVFTAWQADRGRGLDSIMLAPTRELVSELNQRARAHRLGEDQAPAGIPAGPAGIPAGAWSSPRR